MCDTSPMNAHQQSQQAYSYQMHPANQYPNFVPGMNPYMVAPQMANNYQNVQYAPQNSASEIGPTPVRGPVPQLQSQQGQSQVTSTEGSRPSLQKQHSQMQAQAQALNSNTLSSSASAVPSPFTTSMPTPTGSASIPNLNISGVALPQGMPDGVGIPPGQSAGIGQIPGHMQHPLSNNRANAGPGPVPGPGLVPGNATGFNSGLGSGPAPRPASMSSPSHPMAAPQQVPRRRIPPSTNMPYPIRKYLSNMAILRLHEIINLLNLSTGRVGDYDYWLRFTHDIFTPYGIFRLSTKGGEETRQFEFTTPIIPLICQTYGNVGIVRLETIPQQLRAQVLSNGTIYFDCPRCTTTFYYPDGSYMTNFAQVKGVFDSSLKMEWVEFACYSFVPGIEWNSLERLISAEPICHEIFQYLSQKHDGSQLNDEGPTKEDSMPANFLAITKLRSKFKVFENLSSFGIQESFMRALQVNDVISYLKTLKVFQKVHNIQSPLGSLEAYVASSSQNKGRGNAQQPTYATSASPSNPPSAGQQKSSNTPARMPQAKRRQSDVSPLSTTEKVPPTDFSDNSNGNFKKVKY
ncbi:LAFE_0H02762g1_1 [Lachancea fermentati]|uniref:LAFE_0H02762g1_1 n=1 Tax=Lachancea fermentati TaxID=4955 RepID=A0A1G4MJB0_LACFM|nr:LAFE_0H02762g1_1 [Lachancea fermentati]